jgi:putative ATPase
MPRAPRSHASQAGFFPSQDGPEDAPGENTAGAPLAARMRPRGLEDYVGQEHVVGPGKLLRRLLEAGRLPSIILWGPPGVGKTTLARIIASQANATFVAISAVNAGVADLRKVIAEARARKPEQTVLFIDEIHRFNKAQQDAALPVVEDGTVTLIGATTENPSFEVIGPLLSRSRVFALRALDEADLARLVRRALEDTERGLGALNVAMDDDAIEALAASVGGDARIALNALEAAVLSVAPAPSPLAERGSTSKSIEAGASSVPPMTPHPRSATPPGGGETETQVPPSPQAGRGPGGGVLPVRHVTRADIEEALQHRTYLYDRQGDAHYDTISAFIKSLRGSDPDAALYWLARMIEAGEDPLFIVRRMVILASEDVGLADPQAMVIATACQQAVHFIGMPEGFYPLAETALYLALAPKSNSVGSSYGRALADVEATRNDPVPLHLRNAVTGLMRGMGYGAGYQYAHDYAGGIAPDQTYLPERLVGRRYYESKALGWEQDKGRGNRSD